MFHTDLLPGGVQKNKRQNPLPSHIYTQQISHLALTLVEEQGLVMGRGLVEGVQASLQIVHLLCHSRC